MKVRVAESAGFCMGVRKAMDSVLDVTRGASVTYTLGPLIHNPQAIKMLESRNVYVADTINDSLAGETVVIRAHGITLEKRRQLKEIGAKVVDATCPKVLRSEGLIKRYHSRGYSIVIVGDRGHAEIDALLSYTENSGTVVENIDEARRLPLMEKVCVIAQTTFDSVHYKKIAQEICSNAKESYVADTVCASTERRQADIRKLAEVTDATVVVGGKNSANTRRLAEISREIGQPTFLVEDPAELDLEELSHYTEIGVTAGASTPNWVIQQVVDSIAGYTPDVRNSFRGFLMSLVYYGIEGNIILCAAAAVLTYAMCLFMNVLPSKLVILMSFFYLFPMHTVNKYLEINWKQVAIEKMPTLRRYWRINLFVGFVSFIIAIVIAWYLSLLKFLFVIISYILSGIYSVNVVPMTWNTRFKSLRDIPASKDIFIATAWAFAVVVLPFIAQNITPDTIVLLAGGYVFVLVITRTSLLAIGGIQSDRLVGLETIPVLIGRAKTIRLLYKANGVLAATFIIFAVLGVISAKALVLLMPVLYIIACIKFLSRKGRFFTMYHQLILDASFFLTGILAYLFLR